MESVTFEPVTGFVSVIGLSDENNIIGPNINIIKPIKPFLLHYINKKIK